MANTIVAITTMINSLNFLSFNNNIEKIMRYGF